jgi:hypothetical protein
VLVSTAQAGAVDAIEEAKGGVLELRGEVRDKSYAGPNGGSARRSCSVIRLMELKWKSAEIKSSLTYSPIISAQ